MMTDGMLDEIRAQLAEREAQRAGEHPNHTEVVILRRSCWASRIWAMPAMASVEFSGMIRESLGWPQPVREVWNMTKPRTAPAAGWWRACRPGNKQPALAAKAAAPNDQ